MKTFIVDLFHCNPDDLGQEAATHDILGTSESGVAFAQYYGHDYRLYSCEDTDHELNVQDWHEQDKVSSRLRLKLIDINDFDGLPESLTQGQCKVRLILNGQGFIADSSEGSDAIAGLNSGEFIETLKNILAKLNINKKNHQMVELIISACTMARSTDFVNTLYGHFADYENELKIILFKEVLSFDRRGQYCSFLDDGGYKAQSLEELTPDTALILQCGQSKENIFERKMPLNFKFKTLAPEPYFSETQQDIDTKRVALKTSLSVIN
ncbi:MAG: hypothetical protein JSR17_05110 [Proteobacteria bacterium]|nr:hypothetical protein [Pseudomonadota bacterium]